MIVAAEVHDSATEYEAFPKLIDQIKENMDGQLPKEVLADAGYYSEENIFIGSKNDINSYIAPVGENKLLRPKYSEQSNEVVLDSKSLLDQLTENEFGRLATNRLRRLLVKCYLQKAQFLKISFLIKKYVLKR